MMKAENIANKEFRKALYGYDREQVDRFLDEIIEQLQKMEQERLELVDTVEYLVSELTGMNKAEQISDAPAKTTEEIRA